jgi:G3E family GTPase
VERIPVIALTGYLRAGKASVLHHALHTSLGRIGVVINDFGDINVDADAVPHQQGPILHRTPAITESEANGFDARR